MKDSDLSQDMERRKVLLGALGVAGAAAGGTLLNSTAAQASDYGVRHHRGGLVLDIATRFSFDVRTRPFASIKQLTRRAALS
ncbi:MAG: hypothetical protein ACR2PS_00700 [Pseudomonadales bacterium]